MTKVQARVRKQLKRKGMTQSALAAELGISHNYLSYLLRGLRRPTLPLAIKLEAATGIPIKDWAEVA